MARFEVANCDFKLGCATVLVIVPNLRYILYS